MDNDNISLRRIQRISERKTVSEVAFRQNDPRPSTSVQETHNENSFHGFDKNSQDTGSIRSRRSSGTIQRRELELQAEIRKKKLEQEMIDLELALQLQRIEEEENAEASAIEREMEKISIPEWIDGKTCFSKKNDVATQKSQVNSFPINNQENSTNLAMNNCFEKFLIRQSMPQNLPEFSGDPLEWPSFIFQYNNSTAICGFSSEENLSRLRNCLKGQARKVVESLLLLPQNVDRIIQILKNRFGHPEIIINMQIEKIRKLPFVKGENLDSLIIFSDEIKNVVGILENFNDLENLNNLILMKELLSKLPTNLQLGWTDFIFERTLKHPKLIEFSLWLERKANIASLTKMSSQTDKKLFNDTKNKFDKKGVILTTSKNQVTDKVDTCQCCKSEIHNLSDCKKFKDMTTDERWSFVTANKVCFSCLLPRHSIKTCKKIKKCGVNKCTKPHNFLLHKMTKINLTSQSNNCEIMTQTESNLHISTNRSVLLKILPVVISCGETVYHTFALLDDASTVSLIDQNLADELQLNGPKSSLSLQWTDTQLKTQEDSRVVSFMIRGEETNQQFRLRHVRTLKDMSLPSQSIDMNIICSRYPYLDRSVSSMNNAKPRILIGQDNWPLLVSRKLISGPWNSPAQSKTLLGWVIHGNVENGVSITSESLPVCLISQREKDDLDILHETIKQQWTVENFGIAKMDRAMSKEDKRAQEILDKTMKRIGEKFETGLLWKEDNIVLPKSKNNALKRLFTTEKKMDKDPEFALAYCTKLEDMENKGYVRKLSEEEAQIETPKTWYLPHFGVVNPNKPNKLRLVHDAAAKSDGVSINDYLLSGPDLYNSLYSILLNFRIKTFAFVSDIKEMFLQVQVRKEDRCAQRFLWRGMDRNRTPDTYEIEVVFFGSTSGPCLAQEAKNRNALDFKVEFPDACEAIIENHYMDDYLGNADTITEAKQLIHDVCLVHKKGGFTICNWIANSKNVLEDIDSSLIATGQKSIEQNSISSSERILGVWWNPVKDTFSFQTKFHKIDQRLLNGEIVPTKREVLKVVMSIFDPLGFLANFLIQGKVLLQDIWRSKIEWDEKISDKLNEKWKLWIDDLHCIFNFTIPRQYFTLDRHCSQIELHVFTDASEKCYATVAYLRVQNFNEVQVSFITAKAKVASLKPMSIPRLELQGAVMGARLGSYLKENLKLSLTRVIYWTDSRTVLLWIRSEARRFKVFVAQRIGEIQELTNSLDWHYIPSAENVADEATKRNKPLDLSKNSRWINGPSFLKDDPINWPREKREECLVEQEEQLEEFKNDFVYVHTLSNTLAIPDPERFSNWNNLIKSTATVLSFINLKLKKKNNTVHTIEELDKAEKLVLKYSQMKTFSAEYAILQTQQNLPKTSRLYPLDVKLDKDNIIRIIGRLDKSIQLQDDVKNPVVLDPKDKVTKLLLQHYHENNFHFGQETVINKLRQKFWILKMRQAVRATWKSCQKCRNRKATPLVPLMGLLPDCRIEPTVRCFVKTGVDLFGPINVAVKRSTEKRYGVIFTCMTTRAIHLEIAYDLSSNAFIHVLRQFGCRRGFPSEMYSDCGSNFKAADKELSQEIEKLTYNPELVAFCNIKKIKWFFNPPLCPNMGGAWERLIQSVKKVIKEILIERRPQEFVLRTVFAEAENILNSRPLTHVSLDSHDAEALTPNHFLIGPDYAALPCTGLEDANLNLMSKWRAAQNLTDMFWKRWLQEYVPFLVNRKKWHKDIKNIKINDIVIIVDPNGPRNTWPKGIVVKLYPGRDGRIRVVDLRLANGNIIRRPTNKLCILDVKE